MAALAQELERAEKQRILNDQIAAESAMALALKIPAPVPLTEEDKAALVDFVRWANQRNVRHYPAKPTTIAAFIGEIRHLGEERVFATLEAIRRLHDAHATLPNPVATHPVNAVVNQIVKPAEPPRSWPKEEKAMFGTLPAPIQAVIAKRERERETDLRRKQNQLAEELKKLKQEKQSDVEKVDERGTGESQRRDNSSRSTEASPG